jgi:TolA-binding protein
MKEQPLDVDSLPRWRDRPEGGSSEEDRAAALVRDALAADAFAVGLDDRRLHAIEENLKTARRARPPLWLRPAIVAALVSVSVASVMGYEAGWFAPIRERLRFRSIPAAVPEPAEHLTKRATRAETAPVAEPAPAPLPAPAPVPVPVDDPTPGLQAAEAARPRASAPSAPHAPAARGATPAPIQKLAVADTAPPPPAAVERAQPTAASEEIEALERAMGLLRGKHDAPAALAALDDYLARFPNGVLAREARVARVDALLTLDRADEALRALEELPLDAHRRSTELQLIRGELRGRTDCGRAEADFTAVLARVRTAAMEERALYGRAACRSKQGNVGGAADDLRRYVDRFPSGAHVDWARRWLENH